CARGGRGLLSLGNGLQSW
nr:immunoglobulin heavy chain junction region [Macaca mulatta]